MLLRLLGFYEVHLFGGKVRDLSPLKHLKNLMDLILFDTRVRDLSSLAKNRKLRMLQLVNTPVSKKQIEALKKAIPGLEIL